MPYYKHTYTIESLNLFGVKLVPPTAVVNESKMGISETKIELLMSSLSWLMR